LRNSILLFAALFSCLLVDAQQEQGQNLSTGVLMVNHSLLISNRYQLKSSVEQRLPFIFSNVPFFSGTIKPRTDITTGIQRKLNSNFSVAFGGMYRFINNTTEQRLYQQVGFVQQTLSRVKVVHRLRVDETFSVDPTEYRIRYRAGLQLPRSGFRVDPGEHYLAVLAEVLNKFQNKSYRPEVRFTSQFGFLFKNSNKGELMLEVRMDGIGRNSAENLFLLGLSYYLSK